MKKIKIDPYWNQVLSAIQEKDSKAIIAGGAIRDTYMDKPINDIDVFTNHKFSKSDLIKLLDIDTDRGEFVRDISANQDDSELPSRWAEQGAAKAASCGEREGIYSVMEVWKYNQPIVQIVTLQPFMDPVRYVEEKFDIGLCKAYYTGRRVHYSSEFFRDVREKTLTLVGEMNKHELHYCLDVHCRKLQTKFPDHTITVDLNKVFK
jgi:hypothetical protein